jgi:Arc/MetJ-type ribon-helix-helix transcriptional regulator
MSESITARLSNIDIKAIDSLIKAGLYTTRSDFLRAAARNLLREDVPIIPEIIIEMQQQAKKKGMTRGKMLKELRKVRRELYDE